ncbi:hypothetical protein [Streptomyces lunalinharesii]|uniref:Uncharacterized protein n=1 Tax=Streptomyces lunalinharesii TaxID=333384 RepID=A0ABN3T4U7_9ACTN
MLDDGDEETVVRKVLEPVMQAQSVVTATQGKALERDNDWDLYFL